MKGHVDRTMFCRQPMSTRLPSPFLSFRKFRSIPTHLETSNEMENIPYDTLCPNCTNIFADDTLERLHNNLKQEWQFHNFHSTPVAMVDSGRDACRLCALILSCGDVPLQSPTTRWKYALSLCESDEPAARTTPIYKILFQHVAIKKSLLNMCVAAIV